MRKTVSIVGLCALAALGLACSSGGTTSSVNNGGTQPANITATQQTTTATVGQTVTLSSNLVGEKTTIDVTVAHPRQYAKEPGEFGSAPEHGVFLVLNVTVVCKAGTYQANPFDFTFVAADGTVSEGAFAVGFSPELHATGLAAGQKVAGKIVFDVPKAALAGARIQIKGIGLDYDKPAAYWAL